MAKFKYARGRIPDSLEFITREMKEFDSDYATRSLDEYEKDTRLQKLIDRTVENILTALIEICGTVLAEEGIAGENYAEVLKKACEFFGLSGEDVEKVARLAGHRNRLAHRYLNLRWQAVEGYKQSRGALKRLLQAVVAREKKRTEA